MQEAIHLSPQELESALPTFSERGITEFTLQDETILSHKGRLLHFLQAFAERAPDVFLTLPVEAAVLDMDIAKAAGNLFCSLEIPLAGTAKGGAYLFDKKFFARRAAMLNNMGLVFGFTMDFACVPGDSVKAFRDRLDFAVSLMPNHIDFPQLENDCPTPAKPSATFSTQDIRSVKEAAFACQTFYSAGRAVTWFSSILSTLKMNAATFFRDFAEWQRVNNCGLPSGWKLDTARHAEIEKMQLSFLQFKLEEKNKAALFPVASDIIRLNGALARCYGENEESTISLNYNPDDLLSPASLNIAYFAENAFIESCRVRIFADKDGVTYRMVQ